MSRNRALNLIALAAVLIPIALIGGVTYVSFGLVSDTVSNQFRSQELQIGSSLAQQVDTYFNSLTADIAGLALEPDIKATGTAEYEAALGLVDDHSSRYPEVIRTVVRYDYQGKVRYAWPRELDAALDQAGASLPFSLPSDLVRRTEGGDTVVLDVKLYRAGHRDYPEKGTFLLIAPVYTRLERTEFVVYELNYDALFTDIIGVVDLGERGQLWVITNGEVLFQANDRVPITSLTEKFSLASLFSFRDITSTEYNAGNEERLAIIAPIRAQNMAVILSRETNEALRDVATDLRTIFLLAAGATLFIGVLALLVARYLSREAQRRQQEVQRRQTARTLLEISRALNSTLNLQDVLRSIMAELSHILPYDSAAILLLDRSKLLIAAHRGADIQEHEPGEMNLEEAQAANQVLQTGRPLVINDTRQDDRWKTLVAESAIRSWMGIPLRVREKTVGVLNINSHQINRFSEEELDLAEAFADQASVALQNARLHEFEVKQIEQELVLAREIQTSLLPSTTPQLDQLEIAAYTLPARQVSGDYFQYLPMPNGQLGIAVGDVSGKGIPAAILMAMISTALRDEAARNARPADLLGALNQRLLERMKDAHANSALMVGVFDPLTRHFEVANGGMVQPYVRNGKDWSFVSVGGYPLGLSQRVSYEAKVVTLDPGSMLLIATDGIVEAQNTGGEMFGFERLEALLNSLPTDMTAQNLIERLMTAVKEHTSGAEQNDDITIVAIRSLEVIMLALEPAAAAESTLPPPTSEVQAEPAPVETSISPVSSSKGE